MVEKQTAAGDTQVYVYRGKLPMLVGIRDVTQNARPLTSHKRLILADDCGVFVADAFKAGLPMSRECLYRIINRKLCSVLRRTGVILGEDIDEIIQGGPKVVDDFPSQEPGSEVWGVDDGRGGDRLPRFRVYLCENAICTRLLDEPDELFEIRDVFTSPFSTEVGALKFVHEVSST